MAPEKWSAKGRADFVTEVDRESEQLIAKILTEAVPGSLVVGEELSPTALTPGTRHQAPVVWIVDPLDGTTNFLHRYPEYSVSIAAVFDGEIVAGCVYNVPMDNCFYASRGRGAFMDGRQLEVSTIRDPGHALIGTGFPFRDIEHLDTYQKQFAAVTRGTAGIRRAGSAALDLCDVAAGRFEGFWELRLAPWDVAAGVLMIAEAGGIVTSLDGSPHRPFEQSSILAGNRPIHQWLLEQFG